MKIYTKTGDTGETALFGGKRVPKDALRIEAYGSADELNSVLGIVRSLQPAPVIDTAVAKIQSQLFELGADLATPNGQKSSYIPRIKKKHVAMLEKMIDRLDAQLEPLKVFVLPGGSLVASHLHLARTVCRRAERAAVTLARTENIGEHVVTYLNRLSDLLFVMARYANMKEKYPEPKWLNKKRNVKK